MYENGAGESDRAAPSPKEEAERAEARKRQAVAARSGFVHRAFAYAATDGAYDGAYAGGGATDAVAAAAGGFQVAAGRAAIAAGWLESP